MNTQTLHAFARRGAEIRIAEIRAEMSAIHEALQDLAGVALAPQRNGRRPMTPAARAAVSRRMKRYWSQRRAGK